MNVIGILRKLGILRFAPTKAPTPAPKTCLTECSWMMSTIPKKTSRFKKTYPNLQRT